MLPQSKASYIWEITQTGPLADDAIDGTVLTQDGGVFKIHTCVASRASPCLKHLFNECDEDEVHKVIFVPEVSKTVMELMLKTIYGYDVPIQLENAGEILLAANYFQLKSLENQCLVYILNNLNCKTCVDFYILAKKTFYDDIQKNSFRCLKSQFEKIISGDISIAELDIDSFIELLNADDLVVSGEEVVWKAIVKWVESQPKAFDKVSWGAHYPLQDKKLHVYDLLSCLRLDLLQASYIAQEILEHPIVKDNDHCSKRRHTIMLPIESGSGDSVNEDSPIYQLTKEFGLTCRTLGPRVPKVAYIFVPKCDLKTDTSEVFVSFDEFFDEGRKIGVIPNFHPDIILVDEDILFLFEICSNTFFSLNMTTGVWGKIAKQKSCRDNFDVVKFQKTIFVSSALTSFGIDPRTSAIDCYDILTETWSVIPKKPNLRWEKSAVLNEVLYVLGRHISSSKKTLQAMRYISDTKTWLPIATPHNYRIGFALINYNGCLYMIGGNDGTDDLKEVERYDPEINIWEDFDDLPRSVAHPKAVVLGEALVVYDGNPVKKNVFNPPLPMFWEPKNKNWRFAEANSIYNKAKDFITVKINDQELIRCVLNHVE